MKRSFRLRSSTDFERVRRSGKSYAHPLVVLVIARNQLEQVRIGIAAGRTVGSAVVRNRSKRLLRASVDRLFDHLYPGWDVVLIARRPLPAAGLSEVCAAVESLLEKAALVNHPASSDEPRLCE